MTYPTPKAIPKHQLKQDISKMEKTFRNQTGTMGQFFNDTVVEAWNLNDLSPAELLVLQEHSKSRGSSTLLAIHFKR